LSVKGALFVCIAIRRPAPGFGDADDMPDDSSVLIEAAVR